MSPGFKISSFVILLLAVASSALAQNRSDEPRILAGSNKDYDEIAPVMMGNQLVYISNRPVSGPKKGTDMQNQLFFKIVSREKIDEKNWGPQKLFSESLLSNFIDGPASFNEKGDYMAYSTCLSAKPSKSDATKNGIFFADKQNGEWGNVQEFEFNDPAFNNIGPAFNKDASVLYFSSDREGGFGGYDIYLSHYKNGDWTEPENLGPRINTSGNELFPFYSYNNRLYFSSNILDNKPIKYDIFYSLIIDGKWVSRVQLGPPFNKTNSNEYSYSVDSLDQNGFITTDRNNNGTKDIYFFTSSIPPFPAISMEQKKDNFCYVFFEENTVELDTSLYVYEWNLGDNSKVRAMKARHCYINPGNYTVSLNVIDKLTKEVLFAQAEYDLEVTKIIQTYITCPDYIKVGVPVEFSARESYLGDAKPGSYYWDFGDGKDKGSTVSHTFKFPGSFQVKLYIIEDNSEQLKTLSKKERATVKPKEFCNYKTIVVKEN